MTLGDAELEAEESGIARGGFGLGRLRRFGCPLNEDGILFVAESTSDLEILRPENRCCSRAQNHRLGRALGKASLGQSLILQIKELRPSFLCSLTAFYSFCYSCLLQAQGG